jgi:hypothetical protein
VKELTKTIEMKNLAIEECKNTVKQVQSRAVKQQKAAEDKYLQML